MLAAHPVQVHRDGEPFARARQVLVDLPASLLENRRRRAGLAVCGAPNRTRVSPAGEAARVSGPNVVSCTVMLMPYRTPVRGPRLHADHDAGARTARGRSTAAATNHSMPPKRAIGSSA